VLLEYKEVTSAEWGGLLGTPTLILVGFAMCQLCFYVVAALVMKLSGATSYNLSILTADFYSLIVGIYLFQYKVRFFYHKSSFQKYIYILIKGRKQANAKMCGIDKELLWGQAEENEIEF
jgi:solute carrier family 35 protein F1/2